MIIHHIMLARSKDLAWANQHDHVLAGADVLYHVGAVPQHQRGSRHYTYDQVHHTGGNSQSIKVHYTAEPR